MYETFFSLEDPPFTLTPDPRFLLRARRHHEVLSTLIYGITSQKGLMALIGDVGTGKTTLCRALLRELPQEVNSALVLNPYLSDTELLVAILDDLGVEHRGGTKGELMTRLSQYLLAAGADGKTVVAILDEAQQMDQAALEQIRILSTLETATRKLLQIVLVGQPELAEKLAQRDLRQLDQRIAIRCHLEPLSRKETFRYVEHRLRIAGLPGPLPFARSALARIYRYSRGVPRVINLVSDRALTAAFSARAHEVTAATVIAAIRNLQGEHRRRRHATRGLRLALGTRRAVPAVAGVAVVLLVGAAATTAYRSGLSPKAASELLPSWSAVSMAPVGHSVSRATPATIRSSTVPGQPPSLATATEFGSQRLEALLVHALKLWGVKENLSGQVVAAWPVGSDGTLDVPAIASQYQLSATLLPNTSLADLRVMDLPAILELIDRSSRRSWLLKRLDDKSATLTSDEGEDSTMSLDGLSSWRGSAWVIWRNVDLLPSDPARALTPVVLTTLGLRLQKLGLLSLPLPTENDWRFQEAVRRFQSSMALEPDGVVGPRTTLALSRVLDGRFAPTLAGASPTR